MKWQIFGNYSVGRVRSLQVTRFTTGTRIARNVEMLITNPHIVAPLSLGSFFLLFVAIIGFYVSRLIHKE